jgi:RHS repeat-associated protein
VSKTNQLNNVSEQYAYDAIYQLLQVTATPRNQGTTTTESYTYDAAGNRLTALSVPQFTYNSSNELTSTSTAAFTYDANGNMLTKALGGNTTQYAWDFENRLSSAVMPGASGTVRFQYDPFGRRIQKAFTQGTTTTITNYFYDGANDIAEVDQSGSILARYTQAPGVDQPLAEFRSGTASYYEQDGLGSVTSLSNATGSLANTYIYETFGNLASSSGSTANPFQYTGRDFDPETGLKHYRARYYDSSVGRFISEDPNRFLSGSNFYSYVKNGPTTLVDPFGMVGSHPAGLDQAWNEARMLLSDPDCSKFLKDVLVALHDLPDLDLFLQNFDSTNFGWWPKNDSFANKQDYIAHVDHITLSPHNNTVHVAPDAGGSGHCCVVAPVLLHEVLHTYPYAFSDLDIATAVGYKTPTKESPSQYFSQVMAEHCQGKSCKKQ